MGASEKLDSDLTHHFSMPSGPGEGLELPLLIKARKSVMEAIRGHMKGLDETRSFTCWTDLVSSQGLSIVGIGWRA